MILIAGVACCLGVFVWIFNPFSVLDLTARQKRCIPPPSGFSERDLIGTWIAKRLEDTDTLFIREDRKYKQIIRLESTSVEYESDWQSWRLYYSGNGTPYLYLEGMRLCAAFPGQSCDQVGWGNDVKWYDVCRDEWFYLPNGGILAVLGVPKHFIQPSHGMQLMLFTGSAENPWGYKLQDP